MMTKGLLPPTARDDHYRAADDDGGDEVANEVYNELKGWEDNNRLMVAHLQRLLTKMQSTMNYD